MNATQDFVGVYSQMDRLKCQILFKTCEQWPAQWEGELIDGRKIYVRYRHGWLAVGVGSTKELAIDHAVGNDPLVGIQLSENPSQMTLEELRVVTAEFVEWPDDESAEAG